MVYTSHAELSVSLHVKYAKDALQVLVFRCNSCDAGNYDAYRDIWSAGF